jgi:hypothetical protein
MTRALRRRDRSRSTLRLFRDQRLHSAAAAARSEDRQRRADVIEARGEHPRHRRHLVSGILRSVFAVRRQDADAVRGRAGGPGAGVFLSASGILSGKTEGQGGLP